MFGVQGILDAYYNALNQVTFFGPTYFAPFLKSMNSIVENNKQTYHVLLILTDGEITDMDATINEIVKASDLPVSIIIIGVGNESFEKMVILDGDDAELRDSNGDRAKRDIVQFVPFKKFKNSSLDALAAEVLQEVPGQLLEYMSKKRIKPNQRLVVDPNLMIQQQQQQNPQVINLQQWLGSDNLSEQVFEQRCLNKSELEDKNSQPMKLRESIKNCMGGPYVDFRARNV